MDLSERLDIPEGTYVILINGIDLSLQQRFIKPYTNATTAAKQQRASMKVGAFLLGL